MLIERDEIFGWLKRNAPLPFPKSYHDYLRPCVARLHRQHGPACCPDCTEIGNPGEVNKRGRLLLVFRALQSEVTVGGTVARCWTGHKGQLAGIHEQSDWSSERLYRIC